MYMDCPYMVKFNIRPVCFHCITHSGTVPLFILRKALAVRNVCPGLWNGRTDYILGMDKFSRKLCTYLKNL